MNITLIEPFHTGSHAAWIDEYTQRSRHAITLLSLSGHHWKWRMHGGAVTLARRYMESDHAPDLLLASDMLDLTTFLALTRKKTAQLPTAIYFHENQVTYPWSPADSDKNEKRDLHYGFINFSSALAADTLLFNSQYHLEAFNTALPGFLRSFPDHNETGTLADIRTRSKVLSLGLDLHRFDQHLPEPRDDRRPPLLLWNHRWEYDKNPQEFFQVLYRLQEEGIDFEIALLGESFDNSAPPFVEARRRLGARVLQFGYADSFASYAEWLWRADILPVTSQHDFFGASVVQALYCNTMPLLPKRLAYPEHIPNEHHDQVFYADTDDLYKRLRALLLNHSHTPYPDLRSAAARYDWSIQTTHYDELLEALADQ